MRAIIYLTITTIFWGLNFHLAKVMLAQVNFIEAGFWRYLFGVIPMAFLAFNQLPSLKSLAQNIKGISVVGIVGIFGYNIFFFLGLINTSAINGALIISLNPALTLFFSNLILKSPLNLKHIIGIVMAFLGVLFLLLNGNPSSVNAIAFNPSDFLILAANILFALHHVWVKKYATKMENLNFTFLTNLFCLLCYLLFIPFAGLGEFTTYTLSFWFSVVGIGFFGTAVAYFFWNKGVNLAGAVRAGSFMNVVPLSAALLSVLFEESLHSYHLISGLFILSGLIIMNRGKSESESAKNPEVLEMKNK